jgi:hypothetical protein
MKEYIIKYLVDGNHHLITLKICSYNGFILVLMFDWIEDRVYFEKEIKKMIAF